MWCIILLGLNDYYYEVVLYYTLLMFYIILWHFIYDFFLGPSLEKKDPSSIIRFHGTTGISADFPLCIMPAKVRHIVPNENMNISTLVMKSQLIYDTFTVSRISVPPYKFTS